MTGGMRRLEPSLHKNEIALFLGTLLAIAGCRPATYIADEVLVGTDSQSDVGVDSNSSPDSQSDTETGSDSESVAPDCSGFSVTPGDFPRTLDVDGVE